MPRNRRTRRKRRRHRRSRKQCGGVPLLVHNPAEESAGDDNFRYRIVEKINEIINECCPSSGNIPTAVPVGGGRKRRRTRRKRRKR